MVNRDKRNVLSMLEESSRRRRRDALVILGIAATGTAIMFGIGDKGDSPEETEAAQQETGDQVESLLEN